MKRKIEIPTKLTGSSALDETFVNKRLKELELGDLQSSHDIM